MAIPKEIPATDITSADSDTTVYSRTSGRKFEMTELMVENRSGGAARVRVWDGPSADARKKIDMTIAADETIEFDRKYRDFEYGDVVAQADTAPVTISGKGAEY